MRPWFDYLNFVRTSARVNVCIVNSLYTGGSWSWWFFR